MRTPNHASCSLPISQRECTISGIHLLIITKEDGYCARNSHLHHAVGTLVSSVAPPPLRRLVQTAHHFAPAWHTDRPCQKEVRTSRRKCVPSPATDHPPTTGETTCLYQKGSDAPGSSGKNSSDLETGVVHRSARDVTAVASPGLQTLLEVQVEGSFSHTKDFPGNCGLDQGNGKGQPTVGSRADQRRIAQAGHPRLQADHSEVHEAGSHHQATRTDVEHVFTDSCSADLGVRRACLSPISSSTRSSPSSSSNCTPGR